jgi:uncharacterized UBP type Zn finger protein
MHRESSAIDLAVPCVHVAQATVHEVQRPGKACPDCVAIGGEWVHLRECLICGHIGCCDESPNQHATKHFHKTKHPLITSLEPGETWAWCYLDDRILSE